jgi:hypothetical protein
MPASKTAAAAAEVPKKAPVTAANSAAFMALIKRGLVAKEPRAISETHKKRLRTTCHTKVQRAKLIKGVEGVISRIQEALGKCATEVSENTAIALRTIAEKRALIAFIHELGPDDKEEPVAPKKKKVSAPAPKVVPPPAKAKPKPRTSASTSAIGKVIRAPPISSQLEKK